MSENGRSMVEMLGVLAIVGVLSVVGITGYTTAMHSHQANEIANATSLLHVMGLSQNGGEGNMELKYSNVSSAIPRGVNEITYNTSGTVTIDIKDENVCNQVKINSEIKQTIVPPAEHPMS